MTSTFGCKAFSPFSLKYHNYHQITNKLEKSFNKKVSIERELHMHPHWRRCRKRADDAFEKVSTGAETSNAVKTRDRI